MDLSPLYKEQLEKARQEGFEQGFRQEIQRQRRALVECILRARFGVLDEQLATIIDNVFILPSEEFIPLLVQLSREELLARFSAQ